MLCMLLFTKRPPVTTQPNHKNAIPVPFAYDFSPFLHSHFTTAGFIGRLNKLL